MDLKVSLDVADGLPKLGQRTEADVRTVQSTVVKESSALAEAMKAGRIGRAEATNPPPPTDGGAGESAAGANLQEQPLPLPLGRYLARDPESSSNANQSAHAVETARTTRAASSAEHLASGTALDGQPRLDIVAADLASTIVQTTADLPTISEQVLWPDPIPPFTYLAGPAGCGKTFAVKAWQEREKGLMLLATTGIAAINLGGTTINAALGYFDTKSLQESYTNGFLTARLGRLWRAGVKRLVVDEVSMLSGDQLTYLVKGIEEVNGRGYVLGKWDAEDESEPPAMSLTLVGDFAQLPPVKEPFAWESSEWGRFSEPGHTRVLTEIRRQSDAGFIGMLRAARVGDGATVLDYMRGKLHQETDDSFEGPTLFAKNDAVDRYNWIRLGRVTGRDCYFESRREGDQRSEWGNPKKPPNTWGIPLRFHTKVGALVMILANCHAEGPPPQPFVYVNGDLGTVVEADDYSAIVKLQRTGQDVQVGYVRREVLVPCDSARRKELREKGQQAKISENGKFEITGWIEYMPLRVAYGSTVHKSQGLSLDRVQVNIRDAFFKSPGMMYVALSRCRTSEGLRLVGSEAALVERCAADPRLKAWL